MQVGNCDKNLYGRHRFNTMARRTLRDELGQNIRLGHSVSVDKNKIGMIKSAWDAKSQGGFFNAKNQNVSFGGKKWDRFLKSEKLANFLKGMNDVSWTESIFVCLLSLTIKPLAVMATPGAKKEDKQYSAAKSFVSGFVDFGLSTVTILPITYAVKQFGEKINDPSYVKKLTSNVQYLKDKNKFDAFKKTVDYIPKFLMIPVRSALTIALITPTMRYLFPDHKKNNKDKNKNLIKNVNNNNINNMQKYVKNVNNIYLENPAKKFIVENSISDLKNKLSFKNIQEQKVNEQ